MSFLISFYKRSFKLYKFNHASSCHNRIIIKNTADVVLSITGKSIQNEIQLMCIWWIKYFTKFYLTCYFKKSISVSYWDFFSKIWLVKAWFLLILPDPVLLNLFAAPLWVFIFGIIISSSHLLIRFKLIFDRSQDHNHISTFHLSWFFNFGNIGKLLRKTFA